MRAHREVRRSCGGKQEGTHDIDLPHTRKPQVAKVGVDEETGEPDAFGGQRSIQLSYGSSDAQDHSVRIDDAQCLERSFSCRRCAGYGTKVLRQPSCARLVSGPLGEL